MPVVGDTRVLPEALPDSWRKLRDAFAEARRDRRPARHLQGLRRARDLPGPDRRGRRLPGRARRSRGCCATCARRGDATLRVAVGHDMRLHSPALAEAFARGLVDEGCDVLDIGMVGTEMVYYAVGSRELDGGVSVTASHNPKQWAGFKLVREGALPLSGDRGIPDVQRVGRDRGLLRRRRGQGIGRASRPLRGVPAATCWDSSTPEAIRPMKLVLDGGNGMAGPMIGPIIDSFPIDRGAALLRAQRRVPRPRAQPAAGGEPQADHRHGARARRRARASPGTATRTAASSSTTTASSCRATSSRRCSPSRSSPRSRAPRSSTTCAPAARCRTPSSGWAASAVVNRVGHAFFKARMREEQARRSAARCRATTTSATSGTPTPA